MGSISLRREPIGRRLAFPGSLPRAFGTAKHASRPGPATHQAPGRLASAPSATISQSRGGGDSLSKPRSSA